MRTDPPISRMKGPERTSSTRFLAVDADGDVGPDYRPCMVVDNCTCTSKTLPLIQCAMYCTIVVVVLPYDNCCDQVPSRPRAIGAFGSRHSQFRLIFSHLGEQCSSSNFLLLRQGSTSKGFSEPLTERFLYG